MGSTQKNRPFPSFKTCHFQNKANCKTVLVKMSLIRVTIKNHFHTDDFALSLAMKERFGVTWKWSIKTDCFQLKLKKKQTNKQSKAKQNQQAASFKFMWR